MPKYSKSDRDEALAQLRDWIKPGDTVYTILESVSRSGMSRVIRVVLPYVDTSDRALEKLVRAYQSSPHSVSDEYSLSGVLTDTVKAATIDHVHPNYSIAVVLGLSRVKRGDGVIVGGCGMDMGFHLVYGLSHALYPAYTCLGKGKCPSNYHVNHRDRVRCPGVFDATREEGDRYRHCYPIDLRRQIDIGDGQTVNGGHYYGRNVACCLDNDRGCFDEKCDCVCTDCAEVRSEVSGPIICSACKGEGYIANPEGPERFDLIHSDGYALRHRWL